jgi:hypothetical protein
VARRWSKRRFRLLTAAEFFQKVDEAAVKRLETQQSGFSFREIVAIATALEVMSATLMLLSYQEYQKECALGENKLGEGMGN